MSKVLMIKAIELSLLELVQKEKDPKKKSRKIIMSHADTYRNPSYVGCRVNYKV